tara:strand:- start:154 stop:543 length:390 start_codon:yes stop_codon:yes gene_type:complete
MSYLIRIQDQGESKIKTVCSCPVLDDAKFLSIVLSNINPNSWIRVYKESHSFRAGVMTTDQFDDSILMTNDKVHTHILMDEFTIPPLTLKGKVGVKVAFRSPPVNTVRRGKGNFIKIVKKKILSRHKGV